MKKATPKKPSLGDRLATAIGVWAVRAICIAIAALGGWMIDGAQSTQGFESLGLTVGGIGQLLVAGMNWPAST